MGGENEVVVPKSSPATAGVPAASGGGLRVHDNNGEKHFHDDTGHIKAAVPMAVWFKVSLELLTLQKHTWEYLDPVNESLVIFEMKSNTSPDGVTEVHELVWTVKKVIIGPALKSLSGHLKR